MKIQIKMITILCWFTAGVLTMSGCGYTAEEKAAMAEYKAQGKENALAYIESKYGFEAKVKKVTCRTADSSPIPDFSPTPTGGVFVDMEYGGREFRVYISGEEESSEGYDNYQADNIRQAIKEAAESIAGNIVGMELCYGEICVLDNHKNYGLVNNYFDGSNIDEVLGNAEYNRAIIAGVEQNLLAIEPQVITDSFGENAYYAFVDYLSREAYDSDDDKSYNLAGHPIVYNIEDYAIFIDEYRFFSEWEEEYADFELEKYDNFYYCMIGGTYCNFEETTINNVSSWNGRGFRNALSIYEAYEIDTDAEKLMIWIPCKDLRGKIEDGMRVVTRYIYKGETKYSTEVTWEIADGKYITSTLYPTRYKEMVFSVFTDLE